MLGRFLEDVLLGFSAEYFPHPVTRSLQWRIFIPVTSCPACDDGRSSVYYNASGAPRIAAGTGGFPPTANLPFRRNPSLRRGI